ncbi:hypothetical protein CANCADRAFT_90981 [Tortispora caseinolytica NRRL Y-17796]|uniref:Pentacotripeptide-repeat region of PRORP domain-containing protein n=1 Tax=Tortispora caseinolytica NRRL Y-17796 TaxID=767744 RepID=A0A1E4TLS0_9ASCO|nr:hypothetical protein CANCADRAFT_90981 [Tortispora caseinolytica NRRL Y-17796]
MLNGFRKPVYTKGRRLFSYYGLSESLRRSPSRQRRPLPPDGVPRLLFLARSNQPNELLRTLKELENRDFNLNGAPLTALLAHFESLGYFFHATEIGKYLPLQDLHQIPLQHVLYNAVRSRDWDFANSIFVQAVENDCVSTQICNLLLQSCVEQGSMLMAKEFFSQMQLGLAPPDVISYNTIINGYWNSSKDIEQVMHLFYDMQLNLIKPDVFTSAAVLQACLESRNAKHLKSILSYLKQTRLLLHPLIATYQLNFYGRTRNQPAFESVRDSISNLGTKVTPDLAAALLIHRQNLNQTYTVQDVLSVMSPEDVQSPQIASQLLLLSLADPSFDALKALHNVKIIDANLVTRLFTFARTYANMSAKSLEACCAYIHERNAYLINHELTVLLRHWTYQDGRLYLLNGSSVFQDNDRQTQINTINLTMSRGLVADAEQHFTDIRRQLVSANIDHGLAGAMVRGYCENKLYSDALNFIDECDSLVDRRQLARFTDIVHWHQIVSDLEAYKATTSAHSFSEYANERISSYLDRTKRLTAGQVGRIIEVLKTLGLRSVLRDFCDEIPKYMKSVTEDEVHYVYMIAANALAASGDYDHAHQVYAQLIETNTGYKARPKGLLQAMLTAKEYKSGFYFKFAGLWAQSIAEKQQRRHRGEILLGWMYDVADRRKLG